MLFMSCVCHAFASVNCCLVVTCWERTDLLALVCDLYVTFPCSILVQVGYLILSIPDLCRLSYLAFVFLSSTLCALCIETIRNRVNLNKGKITLKNFSWGRMY